MKVFLLKIALKRYQESIEFVEESNDKDEIYSFLSDKKIRTYFGLCYIFSYIFEEYMIKVNHINFVRNSLKSIDIYWRRSKEYIHDTPNIVFSYQYERPFEKFKEEMLGVLNFRLDLIEKMIKFYES